MAPWERRRPRRLTLRIVGRRERRRSEVFRGTWSRAARWRSDVGGWRLAATWWSGKV